MFRILNLLDNTYLYSTSYPAVVEGALYSYAEIYRILDTCKGIKTPFQIAEFEYSEDAKTALYKTGATAGLILSILDKQDRISNILTESEIDAYFEVVKCTES